MERRKSFRLIPIERKETVPKESNYTEKNYIKITAEYAGKNNDYSLCCIFYIFLHTRLKFTAKHCKNTAEGVGIIFTNTLCCNFACNFFQ